MMGEINVYGIAKREIEADVIVCHITFMGEGKTPAEAIALANKGCEKFLEYAEKMDLHCENFKTEGNEIEETYKYHDEETANKAKRNIKIPLSVREARPGQLMKIIEENNINAEYSEEYLFFDEEIKKELLKEAVKDSSVKAGIIAEGIGKTIKGLKTLSIVNGFEDLDFKDVDLDYDITSTPKLITQKLGTPNRADKIGLPISEETVRVKAVWECED